jgi:hypothetical protein
MRQLHRKTPPTSQHAGCARLCSSVVTRNFGPFATGCGNVLVRDGFIRLHDAIGRINSASSLECVLLEIALLPGNNLEL